jgi:hypothetical protein
LKKRESRESGRGAIEKYFNLKGNKTYSSLVSFQAVTMRYQVGVHLREDRALGSESKGLGGGQFYGQRIEFEQGFYFL